MAACQEVAQSGILRHMTYSRCPNCGRLHSVVSLAEAEILDGWALATGDSLDGASFLRCSECGADNAAFISVELSWTPMGQLRSVVAER